MKQFLYVLVFLSLTAEAKADNVYCGQWETIMAPIGELLLKPYVKIPFLDLAFLFLAFFGGKKSGRAKPMDKALQLFLAAVALTWVWGIARGGNAYQSMFQLYGAVIMIFTAMALINVLRTPKDFMGLAKTLIAAAIWRASMCLYFYYGVVRAQNMWPIPPHMTTHGDTVLFVSTIVMLVSYSLETRSRGAILTTVLVSPLMLVAIQLNNRRLAWVSLIAAFVVLYSILPKAELKKKINRAAVILAPILAIYIAVGWDRAEGIFKPVGALSSIVGKKEDASSQTRDIENYNLVQTLKTNPVLGTGWGHEYVEVSVAYSIEEIFAQYRFIPHNSVLGWLGFSGWAGFSGAWMMLPVAVFLSARTYRAGKGPVERAAAATAICEVAIWMNQAYGDMGFGARTPDMFAACAFAVAARLSVHAGAWPGKRRAAVARAARPALTPAPPPVRAAAPPLPSPDRAR